VAVYSVYIPPVPSDMYGHTSEHESSLEEGKSLKNAYRHGTS
jgi:hypothetical protein